MKRHLFLPLFLASLFLSPQVQAYVDDPFASPWATYTYLYLNDKRPVNGTGGSNGESVIYAASIFLTPCTSVTPYGTYEKSKTTGEVIEIEPGLFQQQRSRSDGWGAGARLNHLFQPWLGVSVDYSYVWLDQSVLTESSDSQIPPFKNVFDGYRWTLSGGLNFFFPLPCALFAANLNYLYISTHSDGFANQIDPAIQQLLSGSHTHFGIGSANWTFYLFPDCKVTPFINSGFSYDINRNSDNRTRTEVVTGNPRTPVDLLITFREPLEWNAGGGVQFMTGGFSAAASYLHRKRLGPITADSFTIFISQLF